MAKKTKEQWFEEIQKMITSAIGELETDDSVNMLESLSDWCTDQSAEVVADDEDDEGAVEGEGEETDDAGPAS